MKTETEGKRIQSPPAKDLSQARQFLTALDEGTDQFTFQTYTDTPSGESGPNPDPLARIITGTFDSVKEKLIRLNEKGASVCVMVNQGDGNGAKNENVLRVRAVFSDYDHDRLEPVYKAELEPHLIIQSSPGNHQVYWFCKDLPLDDFSGVQRRIADRFNCDSVTDPSRVMRLPGFLHRKQDPVMVKILEEYPGQLYDAETILDAFPPKGKTERTVTSADPVQTPAEDLPEPDLSDDAAIELAREKNGEKFRKLWTGDLSDVPRKEDGETPDYSSADMSLLNYLVFWTGPDREQIDRLFRRSELYGIRPDTKGAKWDRDDYRELTISEALDRPESEFFSGRLRKFSTAEKIDLLIRLAEQIEWPDGRTAETNYSVYRALLEIAERACTLNPTASVRELVELSGVSKGTIPNARNRLAELNLITVDKSETPYRYEITPPEQIPDIIEQSLVYTRSRTRSDCSSLSGVSGDTVRDTVFYPGALGRKTRRIVVELIRNGGSEQSIQSLADKAGTTARTVRRKMETLTEFNICEIHQEGRRKRVLLNEEWRENLAVYRKVCGTWEKDTDRKIKHRVGQILEETKREEKRCEYDTGKLPGMELRVPVQVHRFLRLARRLKNRPEESGEVLDEIAEIQAEFSDRLTDLSRRLIDLIQEKEAKGIEAWGYDEFPELTGHDAEECSGTCVFPDCGHNDD